jgi:hypothetical protein
MKVFISHGHSDEKLARKVASILEETGLEVWDAGREIMPGDNWAAQVALALEESDAMVVILTPEALRSPWVRHEIEYALGEKGYRHRLVPVFIGPREKLEDTAELPWILKHLRGIVLPDTEVDDEGVREIANTLLNAA